MSKEQVYNLLFGTETPKFITEREKLIIDTLLPIINNEDSGQADISIWNEIMELAIQNIGSVVYVDWDGFAKAANEKYDIKFKTTPRG